jgi:ABC-type oligopeptide transport system ATPase subunit
MNNEILLDIQELEKYFPVTSGLLSKHVGDVKAVDGVTLINARQSNLAIRRADWRAACL